MKKTFIAMTGMVVVDVALTACAGPATGNRVALTLDHGPRAQTTPWLNKQRLLRAEQEAAAKAQEPGASKPDAAKYSALMSLIH